MPKTGKVAFSVIILLAAVTGGLSYVLFSMAAPGPLFSSAAFDPSPFGGPPIGGIEEEGGGTTAAETEQAGSNATGQNQTAIPPDAITISIPQGASVQGNPAYDPETAQAGMDKIVAWKNDDSAPHTATSGELFDSGILNPGDTFTIAAEEIGGGEHEYICTIHPYMKAKIVIK